MLCGSSSLLVQVTVVPGATVSVAGTKAKFWILISADPAAAAGGPPDPAAMQAKFPRRRRAVPGASCPRSYEPPLSQCDVSQRQRMRRRHRDLADADDMAQLLGRYLQRPRPWPLASLGCGVGGRHRCLVGHLALDLLHDLVDVAVEHGHRAKALQIRQCLRCVLGRPAPLRIEWPHWDVGKHHDRRRGTQPLQILLQPFKLVAAETAGVRFLEAQYVGHRDKMYAGMVKAVAARRRCFLGEALEKLLAVVADDVVLTWYVADRLFDALEDLGSRVELSRL